MLTHAQDLVKGSWRYARGLRGFLRRTIDLDEVAAILRNQFQNRQEAFLSVLERGIYENPRSPYRRLLLHAGFDLEDVRSLVQASGLEPALERLHEAGVYVTLNEFKGRTAVRRPGFEFPCERLRLRQPAAHQTLPGQHRRFAQRWHAR